MFWISPLDCEISLWGGPRPGCRVGQSSPVQFAGHFHTLDFVGVLSEAEGIANPIDGWES